MKLFSSLFIAILLAPALSPAADITVSCQLMGPTLDWDYLDLVELEFKADPSTIVPEVPKPGSPGCVPKSIHSARKHDEQRFSSIRISFSACSGYPISIEASGRFGEHTLQLTAPIESLLVPGSYVTAVYSPKGEDQMIKIPQGEVTSVWLQCSKKVIPAQNSKETP